MLYGLGKVVCFFCGFYDITIVGERCSYEDAPLLIAAPHSTIFDIIAIVDSHSVPVSKDGVMKIPIIGVLGRFLQVIFVSRDNKDSRKVVGDTINMRAEMKERRRSLLKRSSQRIRSQLSKVSIGSLKSPNSIPASNTKQS
jgi:1-acyl-sn-glycerol-3-phosphate acyltransferase